MLRNGFAEIKRRAANFAVDFIESGMVVGLGTGSTAQCVIMEIAERLDRKELHSLIFIPSSLKTANFASDLGIELSGIDKVQSIDINIDGADEVDASGNLIKGGGGALLREKIIAQSSRRNVIVVDQSKISTELGENWHLPVEVLPFGYRLEISYIASLGAKPEIRKCVEGKNFKTDQGNYILDCDFGLISDPQWLSSKLEQRAGIIEHGLFVQTTNDLIIGRPDSVEHRHITG